MNIVTIGTPNRFKTFDHDASATVLASLDEREICLCNENGEGSLAFFAVADAVAFAYAAHDHQYLDLAGSGSKGLVIRVQRDGEYADPFYARDPSFTVTSSKFTYYVHLIRQGPRDLEILAMLKGRHCSGPVRVMDRFPLPYDRYTISASEVRRLRTRGATYSLTSARYIGLLLVV